MKSGPLIVPTRDEILAGANIECLEPAEIWTRAPADFVVDLSGGHVDHCLSEQQPNQRHASYRNRCADVLVFGYHHFHGMIDSGNTLLCQEVDYARERLDIHILHHPGRDTAIPQIYRTRKGYRVDYARVRPHAIAGSAYFGTPIEPLNWGMWLLQALPYAVDFLSSGQAEKFLTYMDRDWQRRLLVSVGIAEERLAPYELSTTYHCDDLTFQQSSAIDLTPGPREREIFARVARDVAGVKNSAPKRRIFLSRQSITRESNGTYRALLNEAELVEALSARGYEIVEPETLSFADQIRLFSEAELVIGLGGAALFNVVFSPPGARIVTIESSSAFVHAHACIFSALGHHYGVIFGRQDPNDATPVQKRWSVDVRGVIEAIRQYE
jgi:capsular polysaccharide biosynthesis protein